MKTFNTTANRGKTMLYVGAGALAVAMGSFAAPAYAQEAAVDCAADPSNADCAQSETPIIVVTGSLFRRTDTETASPVTVLSATTLAERGLNAPAEAVQRLPSNGAGTITQGWNTGFNFASGANAPALRGLTVQSTLSIFDGVRMAPYPLADDGQRNFVDLNSIPDAIIERIEVLRDGASSTYGADAIAGVINIVTKKEIQGLHLNGSAGISQRGDAGEQRIDVTYGYGDLADDGFNFYVSAEYQHQDPLFARDRGFPFNTQNLSSICGPSGSCMSNANWNGITPETGAFNGFIDIPGVALARPVTTAGSTSGSGRYSYLNPSAGCGGWNPITITAAQSSTSPLTTCEVDFHNAYIMLQPEIERKGLTARATFNVGDRAQVYMMGNYYNTDTSASFTPLSFRGTPTPPRPSTTGAYNVIAPVYVCPTGVGTLNGLNTGCTAANGVLNPYNPYAAAGQTAQISFRSPRGRTVETGSRALRGVIGLDGSFGDNWNYSANFTASEVQLTRVQENYLIPQRIADVLAQGTFNFFNSSLTPDSVWDYISPTKTTVSTSKLWQAQATLAKELFQLPGGPLQVAVGLSYRNESIDAPSGNPGTALPTDNQYNRYYSLNAVGTGGSRNVKSAFFEIGAPILDQVEVSLSGRYDDYSTGQKSFSPKAGIKIKPIDQVALRGTFSKGFRIPSFNEAFGLPTTGYVTQTVNCTTNAAFCAAHGNNAYATQPYSVGLTSTGNPALDPEKSTSFTAGVIVEPIRNVSVTVDFYHIKVKGLIGSPAGQGTAIAQYYANNGVVTQPGFTAVAGVPDPAFPNALPLLGFLQSSFTNQDSQVVSGLDFGLNATLPLTDSITLRSSFDASYLLKFDLTRSDGTVESYDDTLSPCNTTSCSGAPKWRASWQNSLDFGDTTVSLTAYYTKGYDTASIDFGGIKGDCQFNADNAVSTASYQDGTPVNCRSKNIWNVDMTMSQKIGEKFTLYANILNVLDIKAPFDHSAAYGLFNFNPSWAGPNILGRYFKVGARVDF